MPRSSPTAAAPWPSGFRQGHQTVGSAYSFLVAGKKERWRMEGGGRAGRTRQGDFPWYILVIVLTVFHKVSKTNLSLELRGVS